MKREKKNMFVGARRLAPCARVRQPREPAALPAISHGVGQIFASLHSSTYTSESRTEVCCSSARTPAKFYKIRRN